MVRRVDGYCRSIRQDGIEGDDIIANEAVDPTVSSEAAAKARPHHSNAVAGAGRGHVALVPEIAGDFAVVCPAAEPGGFAAGLDVDSVQGLRVDLDSLKGSKAFCPAVAAVDGEKVDVVLVAVFDLYILSVRGGGILYQGSRTIVATSDSSVGATTTCIQGLWKLVHLLIALANRGSPDPNMRVSLDNWGASSCCTWRTVRSLRLCGNCRRYAGILAASTKAARANSQHRASAEVLITAIRARGRKAGFRSPSGMMCSYNDETCERLDDVHSI